jgi:hypothetical protein
LPETVFAVGQVFFGLSPFGRRQPPVEKTGKPIRGQAILAGLRITPHGLQ